MDKLKALESEFRTYYRPLCLDVTIDKLIMK